MEDVLVTIDTEVSQALRARNVLIKAPQHLLIAYIFPLLHIFSQVTRPCDSVTKSVRSASSFSHEAKLDCPPRLSDPLQRISSVWTSSCCHVPLFLPWASFHWLPGTCYHDQLLHPACSFQKVAFLVFTHRPGLGWSVETLLVL